MISPPQQHTSTTPSYSTKSLQSQELSGGELHLMVLWSTSRHKEKEILEDLQQHLTVLETYDIQWTRDLVIRNFSRFYGAKLSDILFKRKECGTGRFLLITLWDNAPVYELAETSRGHEIVNTRMFDLKSKYRSWTGGGSRIHATNSPEETNHDITLLLGKNSADYLQSTKVPWSGKHIRLDQDLPGSMGWKDLHELFYVLNNTAEYLVLRNHECLPDAFSTAEHGDIDILTLSEQDTANILNAKKVFDISYRVHYKNQVAGTDVFWDIRSLGDNYYCEDWEEDMLRNRVLNKHGIYIQAPENYFYSLVYHASIHKRKIASDYYPRMQSLYDALPDAPPVDVASYPSNIDAFYILLQQYMRAHGYTYTQPHDKSVYFNQDVIGSRDTIKRISRCSRFSDIELIRINLGHANKPTFLRGKFAGREVFIKSMPFDSACTNEYRHGRAMYEALPEHVVEPLYYKKDNGLRFVATEYVNAPTLEEVMQKQELSQELRNSYISQMTSIAKALIQQQIVHRDIRPANLLVMPDHTLKLIDFEFAVSKKKYREMRPVRKSPGIIRDLGDAYALGTYKWDDMYSFARIMKELGATPENNENMKFIVSQIGKHRITYKCRPLLLLARIMVRTLAALTPVKRWRRAMRKKY